MTITFHPDGRVDGINNTNFLNSIATIQRRISTTVILPAANSITHNITTGTKKIEILVSNVSSASNSNLHVLLGDSGGLETSGYDYATGFTRGNNSGGGSNVTAAFSTYGLDSVSYHVFGTWKLHNPHENNWVAQHSFFGTAANDHEFHGVGYKTLSDTLTQINFACTSGNFDSGQITIVETFGSN